MGARRRQLALPGPLHLQVLQLQRFKGEAIKIQLVTGGRRIGIGASGIRTRCIRSRIFRGEFAGGFSGQKRNVDVLKDLTRSDAENTVEGFDEVVAFAAAVLTPEMIFEAESGAELFGLN